MNENVSLVAATRAAQERPADLNLDALFDSAPVGYIIAQADGTVIRVNDTLLEWTGLERQCLIGHDWRGVLLTPAGRTLMETHVAPLLSLKGCAREVSIDLIGAEAKRLPVLMYIDRRSKEGSGPVLSIAIAAAVDRRRYELELLHAKQNAEDASQALRELTTDLEKRVEERTSQLQIATQELDAFSYSVSHDLRAPLRVMLGYAQLLREELSATTGPEATQCLDHIEHAGREMGDLIEGLLDLARSAKLTLQKSPVDISARARMLLEEMAKSDPGRRVHFRVAPGLHCHGDPRLLESLLRNLLGNAWKYTSRTREPRIAVHAEADCSHRWICVSDNGPGIEASQIHRLFQPFERLHVAGEFAGTGVGLSTVKRIVQRHGGAIEAVPNPGGGTTFRFWLPDEA